MSHPATYIEWDPDSQEYVGVVPGYPDARVSAPTLDELQVKLQPVLERCRAESETPAREAPSAPSAKESAPDEPSKDGSSGGRELYQEM